LCWLTILIVTPDFLIPNNQATFDLSTKDKILAYFGDCFDNGSFVPVTLGEFTSKDCPLLKPGITIPYHSLTEVVPDLLRVRLPDDFPSSQHADSVVEMLKNKHVFGPAVSGAGKVCFKFVQFENPFFLI